MCQSGHPSSKRRDGECFFALAHLPLDPFICVQHRYLLSRTHLLGLVAKFGSFSVSVCAPVSMCMSVCVLKNSLDNPVTPVDLTSLFRKMPCCINLCKILIDYLLYMIKKIFLEGL